MKAVITKATRIVSFFNTSHYWGGQLEQEAKKRDVTRGLKQNVETRWYSLALQAVSVEAHRYGFLGRSRNKPMTSYDSH